MTELVLPSLIAIPLITALMIAVVPSFLDEKSTENSDEESSDDTGFSIPFTGLVALVGSSLTFAMSLYVLFEFAVDDGGFQFTSSTPWVDSLGLGWSFGVDGISLFMVVLTGLLFPIALVTTSAHHDSKSYHVWLMLLMAGSMGAFVSLDLLLFFLFFEVVLVPMYFLIGGWGHGNRIYASMKFFLYTMAASALMLVGIASLVWLTAGADGPSFNYLDIREALNAGSFAEENETALTVIFLTFALAFSVKVPVFPIHTWLPDAHTEAPTSGSVILAGVLLKLGTYGFLRFGVGFFPEQIETFAPLFLTLGVIGIVYGAAVATMQKDLKRLVAYSSVAHMGFIVLGIFALNQQGIEGAVLQMVNHGISTGALFILVGWVYERRHTRQISELGGLQKSAPLMAGVFTLVMLSSIGLPGLNGFAGEFLILLGTFQTGRWWAVVAVTGVILAALYLLWAYQRSFHGPAEGENAEMKDLRPYELLGILPLLILIVGLGVYPRPVLDRIEPAVVTLLNPTASADGPADQDGDLRDQATGDGSSEDDASDQPAGEQRPERAGVEGIIGAAEKAEEHDSHGEGDHGDDGHKEDGHKESGDDHKSNGHESDGHEDEGEAAGVDATEDQGEKVDQ